MRKIKRKICVVTGSRSEYGLLYWLMDEIRKDPDLTLQVIATGMHLEKKFGMTYRQILKDGFRINAKVSIRLNSDADEAIARSTGLAIIGLASSYKRLKPDIVVVLGDRFEIFSAATAALLSRIPIAHIHGGEVTEGAYDDAMRHAITKMANLHFVAHKDYAARVIRMGEDPKTVFNYGAPGLDNLRKLTLMSKKNIERSLNFKIDKDVALVTFHPVTLEKGKAQEHIKNLLKALNRSGLRVVFTMPNADAENNIIFKEIKKYVRANPMRARAFGSLGQLKYLSLMKYAALVVGNSSSGLMEAPSLKIPVVNIGTRQEGRLKAANVIDSGYTADSILRAIRKATSKKFRTIAKRTSNPFSKKDTSRNIKRVLKLYNYE